MGEALTAASLFTDLPAERAVLDTTDLEAIVSVADEILTSFRTNPGRWNATETAAHDRAVLTTLLYLSLHTGKRTVAAAIRTLGIRASMGRTTRGRRPHTPHQSRLHRPHHRSGRTQRCRMAPPRPVIHTLRSCPSQPLKNPAPRPFSSIVAPS